MALRIPAVLAFTLVGAAAGAAAVSCGHGSPPTPDARADLCPNACTPRTQQDGSSCPPVTCATGPNFDICPAGCVPVPFS